MAKLRRNMQEIRGLYMKARKDMDVIIEETAHLHEQIDDVNDNFSQILRTLDDFEKQPGYQPQMRAQRQKLATQNLQRRLQERRSLTRTPDTSIWATPEKTLRNRPTPLSTHRRSMQNSRSKNFENTIDSCQATLGSRQDPEDILSMLESTYSPRNRSPRTFSRNDSSRCSFNEVAFGMNIQRDMASTRLIQSPGEVAEHAQIWGELSTISITSNTSLRRRDSLLERQRRAAMLSQLDEIQEDQQVQQPANRVRDCPAMYANDARGRITDNRVVSVSNIDKSHDNEQTLSRPHRAMEVVQAEINMTPANQDEEYVLLSTSINHEQGSANMTFKHGKSTVTYDMGQSNMTYDMGDVMVAYDPEPESLSTPINQTSVSNNRSDRSSDSLSDYGSGHQVPSNTLQSSYISSLQSVPRSQNSITRQFTHSASCHYYHGDLSYDSAYSDNMLPARPHCVGHEQAFPQPTAHSPSSTFISDRTSFMHQRLVRSCVTASSPQSVVKIGCIPSKDTTQKTNMCLLAIF